MRPQESLAHYRIISKLGEGGMGEVWRATDTKLKRDVAIKVLPQILAQDPDRMARFAREAQVLASLNHPNIAAIYGVEERALVMELVEGETLPRGVSAEDALNYACQIADGMDYAHEHNIVHRDLKPANIKVTPEGRVKILDFGLAKAVGNTRTHGDPDASPTITVGGTAGGVVFGTPAYMAPEQARGLTVDRHADIWAFGVILYELLTGKRLFTGNTATDTIVNVLSTDPDLSALPPRFRPIVQRCLRKDVRHRWQSIGDVRIALEESGSMAAAEPVTPEEKKKRAWIVPAVMGAALGLALIVIAVLMMRTHRTAPAPLMRFTDDLGTELSGNGMALSPDGTRLAFVGADNRLHVRSLHSARISTLSGTEGAVRPFFSPDSAWIGFFADRKVKKIAVQEGTPITLCDAANALGASWGSDGNIVYTPNNRSGLMSVHSAGGTSVPVTQLDPKKNELTHRYPQVLSGARAVLFTTGVPGNYDDASIEAQVFKTGERKVIFRGGYHGRYLESGQLVYLHRGQFFAVPMDPDRLEVTGPPVPVLDDVSGFAASANADFDFSGTGTLAYIPRGASQLSLLAWMDASGKLSRMNAPAKAYVPPIRISPDGTRLAMIVQDGSSRNLWVYDWKHDRFFPVTTGQYVVNSTAWSTDGAHLLFETSSAAGDDIYWVRADGGGPPAPLISKVPVSTFPDLTPSPDGKQLIYLSADKVQAVQPDFSDPEHPRATMPPRPLDTGPGRVSEPAFSPDGRWLAYVSDESGHAEVYVTGLAGGAGKWLVSKGGGGSPIWAKESSELFYRANTGRIMMVKYTARGDSFDAAAPQTWADRVVGNRDFALAPDGKRFAVAVSSNESSEKPVTHIVFLLNFFDELRKRAPVK